MTGRGRVGVGLIGAGVISDEYLTNLTRFPDLEVLFVADLDVERAAQQAEKYAVPASGSVDELLRHPGVELVVNLTIPSVHAAVGIQSLESGKHVWSEKPLATTRADGRRLVETARSKGLRVASAPDSFLGPGTQNALRQLDSGVIGTPLTAITVMQTPGPDVWHPRPEFLFQAGAGPLFDFGPYYLTVLVQVFGPISAVTALSSRARSRRSVLSGPRAGSWFDVDVPTHYGVLIDFESGASAQSTFSFDSPIVRAGVVEITGAGGSAVLPDPNAFTGEASIWLPGSDEPQVSRPEASDVGRGLGVLELGRSLRAGRQERASGDLAFHVLDALIAISESAEAHERVSVESRVVPAPLLPSSWNPFESTL